MKKALMALCMVWMFAACGGNPTTPIATKPANDLSGNPDYQKGKELIAKNDCLTCHKVDEKLIGPSYRDVANKYAGTSDTIVAHLAHKVMLGGTGIWGQVPMAAHPNLTEADATALIKYIFLLKQ
jgi:cytochrome c